MPSLFDSRFPSAKPFRGFYFTNITKQNVTTVKIESFNFIAAPFSASTHLAISGAFAVIQRMFSSILAIVSFTPSPAASDSVPNNCRWSGVLIASANKGKVSTNGTLGGDGGEKKGKLIVEQSSKSSSVVTSHRRG